MEVIQLKWKLTDTYVLLQDMIKALNTGHPKITELKVRLFVRFEYSMYPVFLMMK